VKRRRFEHFHVELSVALDQLVPRYTLWLHMCDQGFEPEDLEQDALLRFFDEHLDAFLDDERLMLRKRERGRLRATVARFDPAQPTPYEFMERLSTSFT
jgi:hypothetical protein